MIVNDTITQELERIKAEFEKLKEMKLHIGIQGGNGFGAGGEGREGAPADILTIANVHEFGATIHAKNVKNLAIPIAKKAVGKSPLDFPGLFFLRSENGYLFGCISPNRKGKEPKVKSSPSDTTPKDRKPRNKKIPTKKDDIEFLFILMESVNIPERSFIRAGYDSNEQAIEDIVSTMISHVVFDGWDAESVMDHIGMKIVGLIQEYMNQPFNFKNKGNITKATSNWPDNPLIETGRLRNFVTYRIEKG